MYAFDLTSLTIVKFWRGVLVIINTVHCKAVDDRRVNLLAKSLSPLSKLIDFSSNNIFGSLYILGQECDFKNKSYLEIISFHLLQILIINYLKT